MPTLIDLDGFGHQVLSTAQSGAGFIGTYDSAGNAGTLPNNGGGGVTFDTTNKRLTGHVASIKFVEDGATATFVGRNIAAGNRLIVLSFYLRFASNPAANSIILQLLGPTNIPQLQIATDGKIRCLVAGGTAQATSGSYNDSAWHRIDLRVDTSGTTYTMDWAIDGVSQTQASRASQTAADMTSWRIGGQAASNATFWIQDMVVSATTGDHPIGGHVVYALYPTGEGTDVLGSTNAIVDEAAGNTNLYQKVDDWNGGTPSTTDYVTYSSTTTGDAASNYAEFTMSNPSESVIWDVLGIIAGFAAGTGADAVTVRVVDSSNATIDNIASGLDFSGSATVLGYHRTKLARPSGDWDGTKLSGAKVRFGFATDTNALPRLSAVMFDYATAWSSGAAVNISHTAATATATGGSHVVTTVHALTAGSATGTGGTSIAVKAKPHTAGSATITGGTSKAIRGVPHTAGSATASGGSQLKSVGKAESAGSETIQGGTHAAPVIKIIVHTAGTLTVSGGTNVNRIVKALSAGTATLSGGTLVPQRTVFETAGSATATGSTHVLSFGIPTGNGSLTAQGGTHTAARLVSMSHTAASATVQGGTSKAIRGVTLSAGTLSLAGGTHITIKAKPLTAGSATATGGVQHKTVRVGHTAGEAILEGGGHAIARVGEHNVAGLAGTLTIDGGTHVPAHAFGLPQSAGSATVSGGTSTRRIGVRHTAPSATIQGGTHGLTHTFGVAIPLVAGSLVITGSDAVFDLGIQALSAQVALEGGSHRVSVGVLLDAGDLQLSGGDLNPNMSPTYVFDLLAGELSAVGGTHTVFHRSFRPEWPVSVDNEWLVGVGSEWPGIT